jgi:acyl CoA:acetate/3-ketoacid CoA transferase beta subunit
MRHETDGRTPGFVPHLDTMDMAERQAMTLQFFRPAQVGPDGSANTSRVRAGDRLIRFPGALALPDTPNLMPRVLFYHTAHEPRNLPPVVGFRTVAGGGIERGGYRSLGATMLITDKAVIAFAPAGPPRLVSYHPGESVESVVEATGFVLETGGSVETPAPSVAERAALEAVDPTRLRDTEFKSKAGERSSPGRAHA